MGVDVQDGKPPVVVGEGWQRRTDLLLASSSVQTRLALNRMRVAQECLLQPAAVDLRASPAETLALLEDMYGEVMDRRLLAGSDCWSSDGRLPFCQPGETDSDQGPGPGRNHSQL